MVIKKSRANPGKNGHKSSDCIWNTQNEPPQTAVSVIKSGLMDKKTIIKDKMFREIPDKGIMQK